MRQPSRYLAGKLLTLALGRVVSIGIFTGRTPLDLAPAAGVRNPVLTRYDVTDALASLVADPFMIRADGSWHLFFEALCWRGRARKGEIGHATSGDGRRWAYQRIVLAEPFHLSYPYVFREGADFYMIPESYHAGGVRLYRAAPFPDRWVFVKTLLTGPVFLDSSVFKRDGLWWMLTETNPQLRHDTLRLFWARDLLGPWQEHARSPVLAGTPRSARPGGRVLSTPDRLVRFAQDCSHTYGLSVRAFEITRLSPSDYQEVELGDRPVLTGSGRSWNAGGMHHVDPHPLDDGSWIAAVDGWCDVRGPRLLIDRLRGGR